jgi:hypothetical protein
MSNSRFPVAPRPDPSTAGSGPVRLAESGPKRGSHSMFTMRISLIDGRPLIEGPARTGEDWQAAAIRLIEQARGDGERLELLSRSIRGNPPGSGAGLIAVSAEGPEVGGETRLITNYKIATDPPQF